METLCILEGSVSSGSPQASLVSTVEIHDKCIYVSGSFDKVTTCPNLGKVLSVDLSKRTFISTHKGHGLVSNSFKKFQLKNTRDVYKLKGLLKKKGKIS